MNLVNGVIISKQTTFSCFLPTFAHKVCKVNRAVGKLVSYLPSCYKASQDVSWLFLKYEWNENIFTFVTFLHFYNCYTKLPFNEWSHCTGHSYSSSGKPSKTWGFWKISPVHVLNVELFHCFLQWKEVEISRMKWKEKNIKKTNKTWFWSTFWWNMRIPSLLRLLEVTEKNFQVASVFLFDLKTVSLIAGVAGTQHSQGAIPVIGYEYTRPSSALQLF